VNILRRIFHDHFPAFVQSYDSLYAKDFGKFRLERISHVVDKFESCGDYKKGIARIRGHGTPWHSWSISALFLASASTFARRARRNVPSCLPNTWTNNSSSPSRTGNRLFNPLGRQPRLCGESPKAL